MRLKMITILLALLFSSVALSSLSLADINYSLDQPFQGLAGNSVIEIIYDGNYIWVGTGEGLSRSSDYGATWESFDRTNGLNMDGVSAIAFKDQRLWVATSYNQIIDGVLVPFGSGINMTTDNGDVWESFNPEQATNVGKLAYDLSISDTTVWAACFYGGLIRSKDHGLNWENVYVDSAARADYEEGNYEDYRNRFFSVVADTSETDTTLIWGGTAAGIFKFVYTTSDSADTVIGYQYDDTLETSISGNFVVSIAVQNIDADRKIIWAGTEPTYYGFYALSYTTDEGATWSHALEGDRVWNIAFQDSVIWVATGTGLKRSADFGVTWETFNYMQDKDRPDQQVLSTEFYAVRTVDDSIIWAGNYDGLVMSTDNGQTWKVFRSFLPIGSPQAKTAYAYPNPFSPMTVNRAVRIHYKPKSDGPVSIKIYDFEMRLVRTVIENVDRSGNEEYDETWDGRNDKDELVANGIYFFRLEGPDGQEEWGKIGVIK